MLRNILDKYFDLRSLKEELKKVGVNFLTAGIVGVFINHIAGSVHSLMFSACWWISAMGFICLLLGLFRRMR